MGNEYFIMYNPLTFNLMDMPLDKESTSIHLITYITRKDASKLQSGNYLEYLNFDMEKRREGMVETFAIESYAALYVGNQLGKTAPDKRVIQVDGKRRTIHDVIIDEGKKPKAVFITSMSSNFPTAAAVAIILNFAKIPVILGGIHVSTSRNDVRIFIDDYCPYPELISQVSGPGDSEVISQVIGDLENKALKKEYLGNTTVEDNIWKPLDNVSYMPPMNVDMLKRIPAVGGFFAKKMRIIPVSPFLGCPFSCNFCSISTLPMNQRKLTIRSTKDFLDELEYMQRSGKLDSRFFFFLPDNLLLGGKKIDEILDGIIDRKLRVNFATQISIDVAENEKLLAKLRHAGATHFFIGFETLDMRNLEFIGKHLVSRIKKSGLSVKEYYQSLIKKMQAYGISIHGAFIFGLPFDFFKSFEDNTGMEIAHFCLENHIGLQPCSLTDLPGSKLFDETQKNGTWLYGKQGTMEYLAALCLTDLTETNRLPPDQLDKSALKVASMAFEAIALAGSTYNAFKNGFFMMIKSFCHPTARGQKSIKERIFDSGYSFASQLIVCLYKDHGERVGISSKGIRGGLERLYDLENKNEVREYFSEYICKFKE